MEFGTKSKSEILKMACEISCNIQNSGKEPIFVCVGSDKIVSDSFGAIVGDLLINKYNIPARVYGNLNFNVTKKNFDEVFSFLKDKYPNSYIVIVDSSLSELEDLYSIKVNNCGCFVGGGFNSVKKISGDMSILACVNMVGCNNLMFLKGCKLKSVLNMASVCAKAINLSFSMPKI